VRDRPHWLGSEVLLFFRDSESVLQQILGNRGE